MDIGHTVELLCTVVGVVDHSPFTFTQLSDHLLLLLSLLTTNVRKQQPSLLDQRSSDHDRRRSQKEPHPVGVADGIFTKQSRFDC